METRFPFEMQFSERLSFLLNIEILFLKMQGLAEMCSLVHVMQNVSRGTVYKPYIIKDVYLFQMLCLNQCTLPSHFPQPDETTDYFTVNSFLEIGQRGQRKGKE